MLHAAAPQQYLREFQLSEQEFRFLAQLVHGKTGIVLAAHKRDMVYGRLTRRLRALNLDNFAAYCALLQSEQAEREIPHLVNAITTNLTGFFREPHHFEHLHRVLTERAKAGGPKRLRLWSSACSSGMEPYSMVMTLLHAVPSLEQWDARILATDIDSNMLDVGIKGEYPVSAMGATPAPYRRYTETSSSQTLRMTAEARRLIVFKQLNLLENWPMKGPFDVIFCRNVVIYFDKPTKQRLFARMAELLQPGGWLYIGHSESLNGISDRFEPLGRTVYRRVS